MGILLRLLRPGSMISIGSLGIIFLILWLGPQFGIARRWLVIGVVAVILIWLLVMIVLRVRAARASAALERSLEEQARAQIAGTRPGREKEIEELKGRLLEAVDALKRSRVARGRGKSGALYILPWYMIIGPPAAGKTTLLQKSGLNFPYADPKRDRPSVKGVGGTRNCDWWFAEEAVILDTAGRYVLPVEEDDTHEWLGFLDLLRKHRGRKPLNGLLVAVSVQDLLTGGDEGAEEHAGKIRTRVDEIINRLGITFPVYVVFTKCDLLRGFVEFFEDLNKNERAEAWGATIARERATRLPASQVFREEMAQLETRLLGARIPRLAQGVQGQKRPEILFFPLQFQALRDRLALFLEHLFRQNPYQDSPIFRGFYFTSGTQEGRPIDQVINAMMSGFGLATADEGPYMEPSQTKSYFIERVFSNVIFPDRHMAGPSAAGERRRRALRVRVFAAGALVTALLTVALLVLSASHRALLEDTRALADKAGEILLERSPELTPGNLKDLESLRRKLRAMDFRGQPVTKAMFLGTYQGEPAAAAARRLYLQVVYQGVLRPVAPSLAEKIHRHADSLSVPFETYFNWYRTWLILNDPASRFSRSAVGEVTQVLADYWIERTAGLTAERERGEYLELLRQQLRYATDYPQLLADITPPRRDERLEEEARRTLRRYWTAEGMYTSLLEAGEGLPPVTVADDVDPAEGVVGRDSVPGTFSKKGWEGPVAEFLNRLDEIRSEWVMRDVYHEDPPSIRPALLDRYAQDYARRWTEYLAGVELQGLRDVEATQAFLDRAAKESSPLLRVLRQAERNTRFAGESDPTLLDVTGRFEILNAFFVAPAKGGLLGSLREKVAGGGDGGGDQGPAYLEYLQRVDALAQAYAGISGGGGDLRRCDEYVRLGSWIDTHLPVAGGDPVAAEMARILKLPMNAASHTVRVEVESELQARWNSVFGEYRDRLAGRYPLEDSPTDASLRDFADFFGPGGTFWSFYNDNLASIVAEDGSILNPGVPLSSSFIQALRKARRIRGALFAPGGDAGFTFSVRPSPPERDPASGIVIPVMHLEIGGEPLRYDMGQRRWHEMRWPGTQPEAGAALRLDASKPPAPENLRYEGAWGFFRLLDRTAQIRAGSGEGEVTLIWTLPAGDWDITVKYDVRGLPSRHPLEKDFLRIRLPQRITAG